MTLSRVALILFTMFRSFLLTLALTSLALAQSVERPTPSTQPAVTSTAELLKLVPEGVIPKPGREWNSVKVLVVQQALDQAVGREYKLTASVRTIQRDRNEVSMMTLEPVDNTPCPTLIVARLLGVELLALARMDEGDRINIAGTITKVQLLRRQEGAMSLQIELDPATLVGEPVKTDPPPRPTTKLATP